MLLLLALSPNIAKYCTGYQIASDIQRGTAYQSTRPELTPTLV